MKMCKPIKGKGCEWANSQIAKIGKVYITPPPHSSICINLRWDKFCPKHLIEFVVKDFS